MDYQDTPAFSVADSSDDSLLHQSVEDRESALTYEETAEAEIAAATSEDAEPEEDHAAKDSGNSQDAEPESEDTEPEDIGGAAQRGGARLNELHAEYVHNPTESNVNNLLAEVLLYSFAICKKTCLKHGNSEIIDYILSDVANNAAMKVWLGLQKFNGDSKFSTWAYKIIQRATIDALNKITERKHIDISSTVEDSGGNQSTIDSADDESGGDHDDSSATEAGWNANIDYQKVLAKLCANDRYIVELYQQGCTPKEIGERFKRDAKWASNQLVRLKQLVAHELYIAETILHTCQLDLHSVTELQAGVLYAEDGVDYRALPAKCRCGKGLTGLESKKMLANGEASALHKLGVDGKPVEIAGEIWAAQQVRVPRVGLSSSRAHMEKAYGIGDGGLQHVARNIELEHEITLAERKKLIHEVPAEEYDRDQREQSGRAMSTYFKDERSYPRSSVCVSKVGRECNDDCNHCLKGAAERAERERLRKLPPKNPTTVIEDDAVCAACRSKGMRISQYLDGARKHEHVCGYVQIFKPRVQQSGEVRSVVAA